MVHRDMGPVFDDNLYHLELYGARSTIAHCDLSVVHDYIQWYFKLSHSYIILDALGYLPRLAY